MTDTTSPQPPEPRRPGRPRIHDTPADRVRAHRERKRAEADAATVPTTSVPADPEVAAATLVEALPLLRKEAGDAVTRLTAVAERIAAAVDVLGNESVVDTHLRKAQTESAKVRADADAELAAMREQLDTAVTDRANADAAADAADAALEAATREHDEAMHQTSLAHAAELTAQADEHTATLARWKADREAADTAHAAQVADLQSRLEQATQIVRESEVERAGLTEQLGTARAQADEARADARSTREAAERDTAAATVAIARLESDLTAARERADAERERADAERLRADEVREGAATARVELAEARAQTAAARDRADELRAELASVRAEHSGARTSGRAKVASGDATKNAS